MYVRFVLTGAKVINIFLPARLCKASFKVTKSLSSKVPKFQKFQSLKVSKLECEGVRAIDWQKLATCHFETLKLSKKASLLLRLQIQESVHPFL